MVYLQNEGKIMNSFKPGRVWLDTDGVPIQAHGGSIIVVNNVFYWYGENKEKTTGQNNIWHWGVRCYSSKDLYNWHNEGIIIPPDLDDHDSPLNPVSMMDRPHILFNKKRKKFVAWLKIMAEKGKRAGFTIMEANHILGPYRMINSHLNPHGLDVGDFDLTIDPESSKGYLISQKPHNFIYISELNEDFTNVIGSYTVNFKHSAPPFAREAPASFYRKGNYYLFTSGTTGYFPNPTEMAISNKINGIYKTLGSPHINDRSNTSFGSQISSVFKFPGKDIYIALADRWISNVNERLGFKSGKFEKDIQDKFEKIFDPNHKFAFTEEDQKDIRVNTSKSTYIWLPIIFEKDKPLIEWSNEWKWESLDNDNKKQKRVMSGKMN